MVTISDKVSEGSIQITKTNKPILTKQVKNSRSITGGGCSGTTCNIDSETTNSVTINGSDGGTLSIGSSGSINTTNNGVNINNATNVNINNQGTIDAANGVHGIKIDGSSVVENITNSGSIAGKWNGISVEDGTVKNIINTGSINGASINGNGGIVVNNSTIENLNNSGFINKVQISNKGTISAIYNQGSINNITVNDTLDNLINQENIGSITIQNSNSKINVIANTGSIGSIFANNNGTINTLVNEKTILNSNGNGIQIDANGKVNTIINSGLIQGNINGIRSGGNGANISTIINSGTIKGNTYGITADWGGKIEKIVNTGLISGGLESRTGAIQIGYSGSSVKTIDNKGTMIGRLGLVYGSLDVFSNEGLLQNKINAIHIESSTIKNINNQGNIVSDEQNGMILIYNSTVNTIVNQGNIIGNNGITYEGDNATINTIINQGNIIGRSNTGISLNNNMKITDYIKLENSNALIAGVNAGIHNKGTIGSNNTNNGINKGNVIDLQNGAVIASVTKKDNSFSHNENGTAILNEGVIQGNISLDKSFIYGSIYNKNSITGGINLNNKSYISSINNEKTIANAISLNNQSQIGTITNTGTTSAINLDKSIIGTIINGEKDNTTKGTITNGISLNSESKIDIIENHSTLNVNLNNKSMINQVINHNDTTIDLKNNSYVNVLRNKKGSITITKDNTSYIGGIENSGTIENKFDNEDTMQAIINEGVFEKGINNSGIIESGIVNTGTIKENINNSGSIQAIENTGVLEGNIINGSSLTKDKNSFISQIINKADMKTIENKSQSVIGIIMNTGNIEKIDNTGSINLNNDGFINSIENKINANITHIKNEKTIENITNKGTIDLLENDNDAKISSIDNQGNININNYGNIDNGITNSGTLTLTNGYIHGTINKSSWHGGFIGKNNNGYHIENNNNGKVSIDGWYFDELEYTQSNEQRLENSIIIGGNNIGGIGADKIYVNTSNLILDQHYDSNTFFVDKEGNAIGNETNNNNGIDASNIHSLSGIYKFINAPSEKGKYTVKVNNDELSGKTLAKSMIYSSRLRNINISNILREINGKNFQTEFSQVLDMELSKKGEAYGNDADLLAELEDIFIPNKNPQATHHSFLLPYYNYSSIKIGKSIGQLSSHTTGLMGGSFKELPNDYGSIGFYVGYEDASKEQAIQGLKFDDKTYYGGLTYYGIIVRSGIDQYYISASTRFDYTKTDIEKAYKNISHTVDSEAKVYGYGAEVRLGANYYNTLDIARISPEIGLSYYGMSNKNFSLIHLGGTNEHYLSEQFNFFDAVTALKIYKPLSDKLRTNITIGSVVNLYNDAKGTLKLDKNILESDIDTSKYYGFGQLGLSYAIADNADLSLNYAGVFTFDNTTSHTMFLKLGVWW
ncbi:hypothetical protein A7X81_04255 [Campylobacter ornithocola]|uniref:Autotransporter domain-containing protein n=1 Tax=Campylobacter ornithocola TaxID=1848766 RepID=A0AA91JD03_9BACT|nr:autotransporter outer membrane beta-barrel domain-containing protein [Campylobacter ornithocola]OCX42519.1 hypothetical protein A7X81_04255 [Campylobacter ornithocola]